MCRSDPECQSGTNEAAYCENDGGYLSCNPGVCITEPNNESEITYALQGESCGQANVWCAPGLECDDDGTCQALQVVAVGERCSFARLCDGESFCFYSAEADAEASTCKARAGSRTLQRRVTLPADLMGC